MNKALIITPTGCSPFFDDEFDKENHWTFRKPGRSFDVVPVLFNDYEPLPEQFDWKTQRKGRKWAMLPWVAENLISWEDYDYIGYWDDDYCTDIQSVELALKIARENDMRMFQQSLTSWTVYPILTHNPQFIWAETNFIELGVPFFRNDIFRKVLRFFQDYTPGEAEWGMDKVMCFYLQQTAHVIHASKVKHMRRESYYDKTKAFAEMDYLMKDWFPKYMKDKFNLDYEYTDQQVMYRALTTGNYET
jgi:hypothetical protein